MYILLLLSNVIFSLLVATSSESVQESTKLTHSSKDKHTNGIVNTHIASNNKPPHDSKKHADVDNMLRVPFPTKYYEEHKRKSMKKSPKRTIQKIIKKNRMRNRKLYLHQATSVPTQPSVGDIMEDMYAGELSHRNEDNRPTTQASQKKKSRKWNSKIARYPMPFQKLQSRKDINVHKRSRRDLYRDNVYILKDLDEMKFLRKSKGYDVVSAHVKKYW